MRPIRITSLAHREMAEAALWCQGQQPGLGKRFFDELDEVMGAIRERPASFPKVDGELRRAPLRRFKHAVFFVEEPGNFIVVGVIDMRRNPRVWKSRRP